MMNNQPAENDGGHGGQGELTRGELVLVARAIRNDWPISNDVRAKLVSQMVWLMDNSDERYQVAAAKVLVAADAINARRESTDVSAEKPAAATTINIDNRSVIITPKRIRIPSNGRE